MATNSTGSSIGKAVKRGLVTQGRRTAASGRSPQRSTSGAYSQPGGGGAPF